MQGQSLLWVVATDIGALAGAGLRHRRAGGGRGKTRDHNGKQQCPRDDHAVLHPCFTLGIPVRCLPWSSALTGFRFKGPAHAAMPPGINVK